MPRWRQARIPAACSGSNNPVFRSRGNRFAFRGGGPVFCFVENPGKTDFFRRILGDLEPLPCVAWSRFSCVTWFRFSRRTRPGSSAWLGPGFPAYAARFLCVAWSRFSRRTWPGSSVGLGPVFPAYAARFLCVAWSRFPGVRGPVPLCGLVPFSRRTRPGAIHLSGPCLLRLKYPAFLCLLSFH